MSERKEEPKEKKEEKEEKEKKEKKEKKAKKEKKPELQVLHPDEKIAKCIKEHDNWGLLKPENRFDNPSFNPEKTYESLASASPKLLELINNIKKLDEKDMKKHGKLYKHFIYSDIKSAFGAKLIASGLASAGFTHAYKLKKTPRGMSFVVDFKDAKKQNSFATLTSVAFFEKPIGITFRKELLSAFNKRPTNIYGEDIRIIILDSGFREGIDLFDIKYVHLFEPIATNADEKQAIGRATRFCGQKGLEFDTVYGWPLQVYRYETVIPADIQKYMDNTAPLLAPATNFFNLFMKFSNIDPKKLTFANELQRVIREVAVDKDYTRNVHEFKIPSRKRSSETQGGRPSIYAKKMEEPSRSTPSTPTTPIAHPLSANVSSTTSSKSPETHALTDNESSMNEEDYEKNVDDEFQKRAEDEGTNDKFMWKKAKVENLCVAPPPAKKSKDSTSNPGKAEPAKNYQLVTFGPTQEFIRSVFTPKASLHGMLLNHSVGTGKCHAVDTPIIMYDGTIKMVQDINVGDALMGDDSKPRTVLSLAKGEDDLYDIIPVKGDKYTVNSEHILCLKPTRLGVRFSKNQITQYTASYINTKTGKVNAKSFKTKEEGNAFLDKIHTSDYIYEVPVNEYLQLSKNVKNNLKGYRVGVEFPSKIIDFDPYIIGFWLGDGSQRGPVITSQDATILHYLNTTLRQYNLTLNYQSQYDYRISSYTGRIGDNKLLEALKKYNLINNKHIPHDYKVNSRDIQLQLLAGLIDSDGSADNKGYEITQKNKILADDILFICRSLGFAAYVKKCEKSCMYKGEKKTGTYYRIVISGDQLHEVPVKIPRKKLEPRTQVKNTSVTGISVSHIGRGTYYGFTLDGNNRYLLGDFTVTHNTCSAIATASSSFEKEDYTIIYVTRYTLKPDVWKNMFGQICSEVVQEYLAKGKTLPDAHAARLRLISKKWIEPMSYRQLSNMLEGKNSYHDILVKNNGKRDILNKTLIIIDEAHKLFAADVEGQEKADVDAIRKAFHHSFATSGKDAVKVLMMTATPYTSDPMDMMRLLNLMRDETNAIPESFESFSEIYLNDEGKFSDEGLEKFTKQMKGVISYLNREKDIRSFAYPVFHSVKVAMSDYEYMDAIESYHTLFKKWRQIKEMLDNNIAIIQTHAAERLKRAKAQLELHFKYLIDSHKNCEEKVKNMGVTALLKVHKDNINACKIHITECKATIKNTYKKRAEEIKNTFKAQIKDLKDEMKDIKKEAKKQNIDYDYSDITNEIEEAETKMKNELTKLKQDESYDMANCNDIEVYVKCVKAADVLYEKQIEENKTHIEAEKAKCKLLKEELEKEMKEGNIQIKKDIDEFIVYEHEKLKFDKERVAKAKVAYTEVYNKIYENIPNDQSQRSALDKCLVGKLPSAAKKLLKGESLITLDDDIVTPSVHESDAKKKHNIFLINGHGSENPIEFKKRYTMPKNKALVLFPVCSRPNYMNYGCKMIEMFNNPKYKKVLMNPVKYRRVISDYVGQDIRIFLPGDSVPSLSSDLFLKFEKDDKIILGKSGVFRIDNISEFNREVFPEPSRKYNLGSDSCIKQCGIINGSKEFNNAVYKEVFKDNIYSPAKKGTTYTDFSRNNHQIKDVMDTVGNGIYYYIGCRSGNYEVPLETYGNILEASDKQQDVSHRSRKIKSLVEDLIKDKEFDAENMPSKSESKSPQIKSPERDEDNKDNKDKKGNKDNKDNKERKKIVKMTKEQAEELRKIAEDITKYMEQVDKGNDFPSLDDINNMLEKLKNYPLVPAVTRIMKEATTIKYIIEYIANKQKVATVLRFVNNKTVTEVYVSSEIKQGKTKINFNNKLRGVIPKNLKEDALKCNSARIVDYIKNQFKNEEKVSLKLPLQLSDWSADVIKHVCEKVRV